jgi:hypothetical protein
MTKEQEDKLESFIEDWHYDKKSYQFAKALGQYIFQFTDNLEKQDLADKTINKHIDNCWIIGSLECGYGYRDSFDPAEIFFGVVADHQYEYKRKFNSSKSALNSYCSTWKKLFKYTKELGLLG